MITYTQTASNDVIEFAKLQATQLVNDATDAQQEVQVILQAFEALHSDRQEDIEFGKEVFRLFLEAQ